MSNETKRDVLEKLAECYAELSDAYTYEIGSSDDYDDEPDYLSEYDAALPDNLPVIPKEVGEYIKRWKTDLFTEPLFLIFLTIQHNMNIDNPPDFEAENWIIDHGDTFARAWLDGVWRIEETGEIVKLEAD